MFIKMTGVLPSGIPTSTWSEPCTELVIPQIKGIEVQFIVKSMHIHNTKVNCIFKQLLIFITSF